MRGEKDKANRVARSTAWNKAHPDRVAVFKRKDHLRRAYGLTPGEFRTLFENQEGLCGICSRMMCRCKAGCPTRAVVDHDHAKDGRGSVRGLLCDSCNIGIGRLRDDPRLCRNAANYLEVA